MTFSRILIAFATALSLSLPALAQEPAPSDESLKRGHTIKRPYSPYAGRDFPTKVLWGEASLPLLWL